jgi:hypothetical protein
MLPCPDYLVIGHVTKDLYPGDYKIGGTVTFSALTAQNLGHQAGIVTCSGPGLDLSRLPGDLEIFSHPSEVSTTFENIYCDGHRRQFIRAQARVLTCPDVPKEWKASPIVHLGPVAQEIDAEIVDCFPDALLGLTPQGWMRRWDEHGMVFPAAWTPSDKLFQRADAVILSQEDVGGDVELVRSYAARTRLLVLTTGWQGAMVYCAGRVRSFPAVPVQEVDPTGAGDIFSAAFMSAFYKTQDPWLSAQFANCVAAHSVERSGVDSVPTREEIARCHSLFSAFAQ